MQARSGTVYVATTEPEPEWEDEFNRWYDEEHLPGLLGVPGYLSGRRYLAVDGEPKYMAFYEIESIDAYRSPEHDRAAKTAWTDRLWPHIKAQLAFYQQIFPEQGLLRGAAWADGAAEEGGLMVMRLDVAPQDEPELVDWYTQEHLAALCGVPGVIGARLFRATESGPKYMAMYHLVDPQVQASAAWKRAIDTPWSARMRERFQTRWRTVYRPLQRAGVTRSGGA